MYSTIAPVSAERADPGAVPRQHPNAFRWREDRVDAINSALKSRQTHHGGVFRTAGGKCCFETWRCRLGGPCSPMVRSQRYRKLARKFHG